jgi:hypothetical protein
VIWLMGMQPNWSSSAISAIRLQQRPDR